MQAKEYKQNDEELRHAILLYKFDRICKVTSCSCSGIIFGLVLIERDAKLIQLLL